MHTRLHAYAHSPIHRHNRTRTHTNTHMHETALVSYPMSKQTEMRGSGWVVDTTIVVPCPALECDAISNPSSAGMLACFVCLFFFFFCAMVGVTCQNRKLLRWTPHCAHPIVPFSSLPVVLFAWAWNAEQPRFASYCCAEQSRKGKQPALESNASSPSTATSIITSTTDSTCFI